MDADNVGQEPIATLIARDLRTTRCELAAQCMHRTDKKLCSGGGFLQAVLELCNAMSQEVIKAGVTWRAELEVAWPHELGWQVSTEAAECASI